MFDLGALPEWAAQAVRIGIIVVTAVVGFLLLRAAVGVGTQHILQRRREKGEESILPQAELERRVKTIGRLLVKILGGVIAVIAVLMILAQVGIDIGPALATLGVVGIAVGFGAQTLIRDWLAGIFVVLENQFSEGDAVRIAGVEGVVEDLSLRRTLLRGADGSVHNVPNGQIIVATNLSRGAGGLPPPPDEDAEAS
jgi:moderate conductance mechanosensitive channel